LKASKRHTLSEYIIQLQQQNKGFHEAMAMARFENKLQKNKTWHKHYQKLSTAVTLKPN